MADENENKIKEDINSELKNQKRAAGIAGLEAVATAKEEIRAKNSYSSGRLIRSINSEVGEDNSGIFVDIFSSVKYAKTVHTGISEIAPKYEEIKEWLSRKVQLGHIPLHEWAKQREIKGKRKTLALDKVLLRLSYKITERIQQTGKIKSVNPFFDQAIINAQEKLTEELKKDEL